MSRILEARNSATPEEASSYVDKYEEFEAEIEAIKIRNMNEVRAVKTKQKELLDEAKGVGIAKGTIKAVVKARKYEAKAKDILADLECDERDTAVAIRRALGDDFSTLPLGAAAVGRAEEDKPRDNTAAIVEAAKEAWSDSEALSAAE